MKFFSFFTNKTEPKHNDRPNIIKNNKPFKNHRNIFKKYFPQILKIVVFVHSFRVWKKGQIKNQKLSNLISLKRLRVIYKV